MYPQGSEILEINEALKTASKSGIGNVKFPEYTVVVKDFLLVKKKLMFLNIFYKIKNKNTDKELLHPTLKTYILSFLTTDTSGTKRHIQKTSRKFN